MLGQVQPQHMDLMTKVLRKNAMNIIEITLARPTSGAKPATFAPLEVSLLCFLNLLSVQSWVILVILVCTKNFQISDYSKLAVLSRCCLKKIHWWQLTPPPAHIFSQVPRQTRLWSIKSMVSVTVWCAV